MISFHNLTHRTYCEPDSTYQQLHNLTLGGEAVSVTNFELKRDVGIFHLHSLGNVVLRDAGARQDHGSGFVGDGATLFWMLPSNLRGRVESS